MLTTKPTLSLSLKIKKEINVEPEPTQTTETTKTTETTQTDVANNIDNNIDNNISEETLPTDNANQIESIIPKIVFIIPYRDRAEHKVFFSVYMKHVLEDIPKTDYEIYYVEQ